MANCKYKFQNQVFDSYASLLDYIDKLDLELENVSDIVYSKTPKRDLQLQKLQNLKQEYYIKEFDDQSNVSDMINGEPDAKNGLSILEFIDTPACSIEGRPLVTPMNKEDYLELEAEALINKENPTLEEKEIARKEVQKIVDHWDIIKQDGFHLHRIFADKNVVNSTNGTFTSKTKESLPEKFKDELLLTNLFYDLNRVYSEEKGKFPESKCIRNVNLSAKIKGLSKKLLGHIDYLIVGKDGTLHLYLYKTTASNPFTWSKVKKIKYKLQLSFLKKMLAANGINIKNIDLNIIPVQMQYNDDYSELLNIKVHSPKQYSTRRRDGAYAMEKYDKQTSYFIEDNSIPKSIPLSVFQKNVNNVINAIFPELNINSEGLSKSAREWIKYAPSVDYSGAEQLIIKHIGDIDHGYDVIINGKTFPIKSNKNKNYNPEIFELIQSYISTLNDQRGYITQKLKDAIQDSYRKGFASFEGVQGLVDSASTLQAILGKYVQGEKDESGEIINSKWELMEDLIDSNLLIFRNKEDNTLDFISLTSFDLNSKASFSKGKNILGCYKRDSEYIDLKGDYGNIEIVRAMAIINEALPQLGDNVKLGNISVLSTIKGTAFRSFDMGEFNKNYYNKIIETVKHENSRMDIENNFSKAVFTNPVETIINEYLRITDGKPDSILASYQSYGFDQLDNSLDKDQKLKVLGYIMEQILSMYPSFADPEKFKLTINSYGNSISKDLALLYDLVTKAYLNLSGETPKYQTNLDPLSKNLFTAPTIPDPNIRIVVDNLQITHDTISSEFLKIYDKEIFPKFSEFYKNISYSSAQNMTLGNQAQQYKNFFSEEEPMTFKNPYDKSNNLSNEERKLLKWVLYKIYNIKSNGQFKYSNLDDPKLIAYINAHPEYFWVPLERASRATSRQSGKAIVAKLKNSFNRFKEAGERFDEFVNNITSEERDLLGEDDSQFYRMNLTNPFDLSIPGKRGVEEVYKSRQKMIEKYGEGFFETNVQNIIIDFLVKQIQTEQLNKLLVTSKALMLQLHLTGDFGGNKNVVEKEIKYIQDYLKVNIFNTSIMSNTEKKIVGTITPVKRLVTNMLLGGNVVSMFRDTFEGLQQNFIRSVIKLNTDIDPKSVAKAYAYVTKNATSDAMAVNLLSKLCLKYRLSNTDVGRIAERAKSGRNGIFNYDNWMYGTLRSPDFLNRMVLFVSKCMHDCVWEAFSIDKDNNLVYDWTKDKRFELYFNKDIDNPKYNEQKSLYLSKIREYNQEHPEHRIDPDDGLPSPYSNREIMSIRAVGDNIYGAYDRGKRAMAENMSIGIMFGMFTTWMNGMVNTYFMKPQKNGISMLKKVQEVDENGNLLFLTEDGGVTTEDTGLIAWKDEPIIIQGIMYTVLTAINICKNDGRKAFMDYLRANPHEKANMRKLISDVLMWFLLSLIFKLAITPAYKDYKKEMHLHSVGENLITEILYKSSSRSYDQFKGPINMLQFFGENLNPPFYSQPIQVLKETGETLIGEKSWKYLLFDNTGFTRSVKDTGFAFIKSQQ